MAGEEEAEERDFLLLPHAFRQPRERSTKEGRTSIGEARGFTRHQQILTNHGPHKLLCRVRHMRSKFNSDRESAYVEILKMVKNYGGSLELDKFLELREKFQQFQYTIECIFHSWSGVEVKSTQASSKKYGLRFVIFRRLLYLVHTHGHGSAFRGDGKIWYSVGRVAKLGSLGRGKILRSLGGEWGGVKLNFQSNNIISSLHSLTCFLTQDSHNT